MKNGGDMCMRDTPAAADTGKTLTAIIQDALRESLRRRKASVQPEIDILSRRIATTLGSMLPADCGLKTWSRDGCPMPLSFVVNLVLVLCTWAPAAYQFSHAF